MNGAPARSPWFGIAGAVLLITLLAAIAVQVRQVLVLDETTRHQNDYLVVNLHQSEIDYLRLREAWSSAMVDPATARDRLQTRYDIFVSRTSLLRTEASDRLFGQRAGHSALLRQLDGFVQRADLYFAQSPRAEFSTASLQALLAELQALDAPLHQLLLDASHQVAEDLTERNASVRVHNRIGLALTAALLVLLLVFGQLAMRRLRQVQESRATAEALASRLQDARAELLRAGQARSEFLAQMSQAIRTPFHGLIGTLSLLQESRLDARQQELLHQADDAASQLLALINDILDLARLDAGALRLLPQPVDPRALVQAVEHPARAQASAKGLALRMHVDAQLPSRVLLDGARVRQILHNLLGQAIRDTAIGSIDLRVGLDPQTPVLVFEIADTGAAIDAAELQSLFDPAGPAGATRSRRLAGPALEIARKLARLMGGDLEARSTPGEGNTYMLRLPFASAIEVPPTAEGAAEASRAAPRALQILVAEDHPVNRRYFASLLELLGHRAIFVDDGWQAVEAVQARSFDLVLMDVHMPVMDGIVATRTIRALEGHDASLPIVALTADDQAETRERCLVAGMQEVLTKPVSLVDLKALLVRHFGSAAGLSAAAPATDGSAQAKPLMDPAALARLLELMPRKESAALFVTLLSQAAEASTRMRRALREADAAELEHASQGVKGAALNLGLRALAEAAEEIRVHAATLNATALALALQRYDETLEATRELCRAESLLDGT
ncbi:MAG: response regulator [Burkholderiaceae bacterium]|nr:response regulator [Burkholderiaceae bacterium]